MPSLQVRKLEFLLGEAITQGCDTIVTVGGHQSNHARSTALAAREVGLDTHLLLRGSNKEVRLSDCADVMIKIPLSFHSRIHRIPQRLVVVAISSWIASRQPNWWWSHPTLSGVDQSRNR